MMTLLHGFSVHFNVSYNGRCLQKRQNTREFIHKPPGCPHCGQKLSHRQALLFNIKQSLHVPFLVRLSSITHAFHPKSYFCPILSSSSILCFGDRNKPLGPIA